MAIIRAVPSVKERPLLDASKLHVFTARSNPLYWGMPHKHWNAFATQMLDAGVNLTVIECAPGSEDFFCADPPMSDPAHAARFMHVGVRSRSRGWNKENLLNLGVQRRPEADYIAWVDADVFFRRPDWALATVRALQYYDVVQPWQTCYDLGPNDEHIAAHTSFCRQFFLGLPLTPPNWSEPYWIGQGGKNVYPHCLPADSLVVPGGEVIAASSRPFEGDLVVIRTASGQELTCSPNHPILSGDRWLRADEIKIGDNVFRHVRGNGSPVEPHEEHAPARIEDVVRSFGERQGMNRFALLLPDNLDNRRANSKVAHVWTNRDLATEDNARFANDFAGVVDVHADNPRALRRALAAQIEADQVVYVGRREFCGQLYDLQTRHGHIIADNIVTHNSGYAWAMTRRTFDAVGGLFEMAGMGSGDHHMALGMAGLGQQSLPPGPNTVYCEEVMRWSDRAVRHINGNIGYVGGTLEHRYHGRKSDRGYMSRWNMFIKYGFDPHADLKRNSYGVLEFATNKPDLRRAFDRYLQSRNEDANIM